MSIKLNAQSGGSVALDAPTQTTGSADNLYKLPIADGTAGQVLTTDGSGNLSWSTTGITMVDEFRGNTETSWNPNTTLTFWERTDTNFEGIGTGMTHSSGIFTFPTTGKYLINCNLTGRRENTNQPYVGNIIELSTDGGSNYSIMAAGWTNADSTNAHFSILTTKILDVTNTSNFKIYVRGNTANDIRFFGNTNSNRSTIQFIRLGDT